MNCELYECGMETIPCSVEPPDLHISYFISCPRPNIWYPSNSNVQCIMYVKCQVKSLFHILYSGVPPLPTSTLKEKVHRQVRRRGKSFHVYFHLQPTTYDYDLENWVSRVQSSEVRFGLAGPGLRIFSLSTFSLHSHFNFSTHNHIMTYDFGIMNDW